MTILNFDPAAALILIDLQKGIVSLPTCGPSDQVVARAAALAGTFRQLGLPVILVNVVGGAPGRTQIGHSGGELPSDFAEFVPQLELQPTDIVISKTRWGAFYGTELDRSLRAQGVTQVVLAGIATSMGVESTARAAHEHGYNVTLVTDAMTDLDSSRHLNSVERVFPMLGELGTTQEVIDRLNQVVKIG